jgi:hypothetical protein
VPEDLRFLLLVLSGCFEHRSVRPRESNSYQYLASAWTECRTHNRTLTSSSVVSLCALMRWYRSTNAMKDVSKSGP